MPTSNIFFISFFVGRRVYSKQKPWTKRRRYSTTDESEPIGIEKSLDQRIVTVVGEIGSRLVYFCSVVGEIG